MDQETMKFMEELQEFVQKAQRFLQEKGGNYGQRGFYGMREGGSSGGSQGSGYNQGGSYGQREQPWMHHGMQGQGWGGQMPNIDPRYFM